MKKDLQISIQIWFETHNHITGFRYVKKYNEEAYLIENKYPSKSKNE